MRLPLGPLAIAAAGALATACTTGPLDAPLSTTFGEAVASMDRQIIDPTPAQGLPSTSAVKAADAIARYENDRVTEPVSSYGEKVAGSVTDNQGAGTPESGGSKTPQ
jgi:hypothetical protein